MSDDNDLFDLLASEAAARVRLHEGQASNRPLSEDFEFVGLVGEVEFARAYRQPLDLQFRRGGDNGIDFIVPLAFTLDVKCARNAFNLLVEQGKVEADIYVLAQYSDVARRADLLGWEYGATIARAPFKDFGFGIVNHYIPRGALRPMAELGRRIMRLSFNGRPT